MVLKKVAAFGIVFLGFFAFVVCLLIGCDDTPTDPPEAPSEIIGTWYGLTVRPRVQQDDTFDISLSIKESGAYRMVRSSIVHGSSLGKPDTLKEVGLWSLVGSDSVIFEPDQDSCQLWDAGAEVMQTGPGLCATPVQFKVAVTGNTWTQDVMNFRDSDEKFSTVMNKQ